MRRIAGFAACIHAIVWTAMASAQTSAYPSPSTPFPVRAQLLQPTASQIRDTQPLPPVMYQDQQLPIAIQQPTDPAQPTAEQKALAELKTAVETMGKKLTVMTANDDFKVIIGGAVVADFLWSSARPVAPGTPFFLTPKSPFGFDQDTFDANARQTNIAALIMGPKICGDIETGGVIFVNLYNDATIVDRYGLLPILAYGQLKTDGGRFAAGLQFDIFNPLNPNILPFSLLAASGNTGLFRGQARCENYYYFNPLAQGTFTVGISEPVPTTVNDAFQLSEDNGWPNVEARAALALGPIIGEGLAAKRPFEVGASGVVGQMRTTSGPVRVVGDVWGCGTDLRWAFTPCCGIQGELYMGQGMGTYGGADLQNINSATFETIQSAGGWGEVYVYLVPDCLHSHWGYGIDDPLDGDLSLGQPVRNETYFGNLIWDITKNVRAAFEVTYRRTAYTLLNNNEGITLHTQFQWKF